jgi:hypothetical protein
LASRPSVQSTMVVTQCGQFPRAALPLQQRDRTRGFLSSKQRDKTQADGCRVRLDHHGQSHTTWATDVAGF